MFRNPLYLLGMLASAALAGGLFYWAAARRRKLAGLMGNPGTIARLLPPETAARRRLKAAAQTAALALIFIALAGPQWGVELVTTKASVRQVVIAVDVSLSMLAEDVSPNRMEKSKNELSLLLDSLRGNRVGIAAFAGDAGMICPLTSDIDAAKQILGGLSVGSIPTPGTAIGTAVRTAAEALGRYSGGKAVVLLTDGEDHHTDPLGAAAEAAASGIKIYAIGIGTPEGTPLPIKEAGSNALTGYKKDRKGQTVISRLGEKTLMEMAQATGGAYWRASPSADEVADIARQIDALEKSQGVSGTAHQYRNRFLFPLGLAFLLLLGELLIPLRRVAAGLLLLALIPAPARAAGAESDLRAGNKLYEKMRYEEALQRYRRAQKPGDPRPEFNSADALFRLEDYDLAAQGFLRLAEDPKAPPAMRADAYYNLGNALAGKQDYRGAVAAFRRAVVLNPKDTDARHNLAVALRMLKNPPPPRKQCNNPKQNQQSKPDDSRKQGQGGKSQDQQKPPPPRPHGQMSKEDAQRIMRSVSEKERPDHKLIQQKPKREPPQGQEDW
ncbi:MAG TPA: hypothetical protein DEB40_03610 [Elusimicrobia bacterium]|nr:hypothetical protein [Elusimicrobiota bacterium]HBT60813.1 hypothetical protein [Elusimicrobiota bacterium]